MNENKSVHYYYEQGSRHVFSTALVRSQGTSVTRMAATYLFAVCVINVVRTEGESRSPTYTKVSKFSLGSLCIRAKKSAAKESSRDMPIDVPRETSNFDPASAN